MRALYYLIGFVLDLLVLAAGAALVLFSVRFEWLDDAFYNVRTVLQDEPSGALALGALGVGLIMCALRSVLLLTGRPEEAFEVTRSDGGTVSLSYSAIESFVQHLLKQKDPGRVRKLAIRKQAGQICLSLRFDLDLTVGQMPQRVQQIEALIRERFKNDLGIEVGAVDIRLEFGKPAGSRAVEQT